MNYSFDITNSINSIEIDDDMKSRILNVEDAKIKIKQREAKIKRKRREKMLLTLLMVSVSLFVATNTTTYAMTGKSLISFFFSEKEQITYEALVNDSDYGFIVDGYTFNIIEALYEKNTQSGCWVVAITKDGKAPEITLDGTKHMISKGFGENERFELAPYYRDKIEYEIRDDALYACLIYHDDIEDYSTFELVDYKGPWKNAWDESKPIQENKVSENSESSSDAVTGLAIGDYKVYNLGKTQVYLKESGGWNREGTEYVDGLGIEFDVDMTGGCFCLSGADEFGTNVYVSPFGFMIYSETEGFYTEKCLNMKNGEQMYIMVDYSGVQNIEGIDGIIVRNQYTCGGTYYSRIDLDNVESITIDGSTIELSKVMKEEKGALPVTDYTQYQENNITSEQMKLVSDWINDEAHYGFLCSSYEDVSKADFDLIFMNAAGLRYELASKEELAQYTVDICNDPIKIRYDVVEEFITQTTGRSWVEFRNGRYMDCVDQIITEYFYIDNRKINHGKFECVAGTQKGDLITAIVKCDDYKSKLLLRQVGDSFRVICNIVSDENIQVIEKEEQKWGMIGKIVSKEQSGIVVERDEHWIKDGNNVYTKHIENNLVSKTYSFYRDNKIVYTWDILPDESTSGGPIGDDAKDLVFPYDNVRFKIEEADITGITDISQTNVTFNYIGEETAFCDSYWRVSWPYEIYTTEEDVINSNLINLYGKKVGESVLFIKHMNDGRTIMTKCTILEIIY